MNGGDERNVLSVAMDTPEAPTSDESDVGIRRQFRAMKTRLEELELLYATRHRYQVPTSITEAETAHGLRCGFHPHVVVSMRTPLVKCAVCSEELDPLDVLRQFTNGERTFAFALEHLRKEKADLKTEIDKLKRMRANLRAQIKRADRVKL